MRSAGRDIPTQSSAAPMSNNNNNNNWGVPSTLNNLPQTLKNTASSARNLGVQGATSARNLMSNIPTSFGSLNPISMSQSGSDVGLDSAQHPKLSANTAQQLNEALNFASSNNGSRMGSSGMMMMQSNNNMMSTANSSSNTSSNNNLSLNTAELATAAGMGLSDISGSNGMSTTSAQAYSALLREYSMKEEDMLMQQFLQQQQGGQESMPPQVQSPQDLTQDQVQQQFEQLQQQQQFIQQQQSLQSNAPMIQKGQQPQSYLTLGWNRYKMKAMCLEIYYEHIQNHRYRHPSHINRSRRHNPSSL